MIAWHLFSLSRRAGVELSKARSISHQILNTPFRRQLWHTLLDEAIFAGLSRLSLALEGCPFAVLGELKPAMDLLVHVSAQVDHEGDPEAITAGVGLCERLLNSYLSDRDDAAVSYMGHAVLRRAMLFLSNLAAQLRSREEGEERRLEFQGTARSVPFLSLKLVDRQSASECCSHGLNYQINKST